MMSNDDSIQIVPQMEAPADDDSFNRDVCEVTNDNDNANDTADDIGTTAFSLAFSEYVRWAPAAFLPARKLVSDMTSLSSPFCTAGASLRSN